MTDLINHPPHYQAATGIKGECIDYTRQMPFSVGNAFKYVWRAGQKGDAGQDLDKATWYLNDAMMHGGESMRSVHLITDGSAPMTRRRYLLGCIARSDLQRARKLLGALIHPAQLDDVIQP